MMRIEDLFITPMIGQFTRRGDRRGCYWINTGIEWGIAGHRRFHPGRAIHGPIFEDSSNEYVDRVTEAAWRDAFGAAAALALGVALTGQPYSGLWWTKPNLEWV